MYVMLQQSQGDNLYFKLDIILVKKIHVIRVVFQDQAMYVHTSLRGAKSCKIGNKGVFCHFYKFGKGHEGKLRKKICKNA